MIRSKVLAQHIAKQVNDHARDFNVPLGRWNKTIGQILVYGNERAIGFEWAVELCAVCEVNWKAKKPLEPALEVFFATLLKAKGLEDCVYVKRA